MSDGASDICHPTPHVKPGGPAQFLYRSRKPRGLKRHQSPPKTVCLSSVIRQPSAREHRLLTKSALCAPSSFFPRAMSASPTTPAWVITRVKELVAEGKHNYIVAGLITAEGFAWL